MNLAMSGRAVAYHELSSVVVVDHSRVPTVSDRPFARSLGALFSDLLMEPPRLPRSVVSPLWLGLSTSRMGSSWIHALNHQLANAKAIEINTKQIEAETYGWPRVIAPTLKKLSLAIDCGHPAWDRDVRDHVRDPLPRLQLTPCDIDQAIRTFRQAFRYFNWMATDRSRRADFAAFIGSVALDHDLHDAGEPPAGRARDWCDGPSVPLAEQRAAAQPRETRAGPAAEGSGSDPDAAGHGRSANPGQKSST
jgi:hypothetical protein